MTIVVRRPTPYPLMTEIAGVDSRYDARRLQAEVGGRRLGMRDLMAKGPTLGHLDSELCTRYALDYRYA